VLTLRGLAASFLVVGTLFFVFPDRTVAVMNAVGSRLGRFTPAPPSALRFWLSLATGYMALVTGLAYYAQRDLRGSRDMLALLALGKGVSSLTCLGFYWFSLDAFIYLANFLVDGSITLIALAIWRIVPSLGTAVSDVATAPPPSERTAAAFAAILDAMIPPGGPFPEGARDTSLVADVDGFAAGAGASVPAALRFAVRVLDLCPLVIPPLRGRRFSQLSLDERVHVLEAWEGSRLAPLRQLLHTLKLLAMTHFYSQPAIQARLGYPHPLTRVPREDR